MEKLQPDNFIEKMNNWGVERIPFIFIIDFEMKNPVVLPLDEAAKNDIYFKFPNLNIASNQDNTSNQNFKQNKFTFKKFPVSFEAFKNSFELVSNEIKIGNSFLTNLTFPTPIKTNLSLLEIFHRSDAPFKLLYKDQFVVFSPELFITISGHTISSYPMKGTIDSAIPNAKRKILNDLKETAEHHTIVDMIRNDLSMVSTNVKVEKFRFLNSLKTNDKTLLQVSSKITGQLPANYQAHLGDILFKLLPAGSICGAPKKKSLEIISKSETYKRGYYTGVFGVYDGTELHSAVMIRFIEKNGKVFLFKSGGGITFYSDPAKEYQELIDKVYVPIH